VARALEEHGELHPVAKRSVGKPSKGGRKWAVRHADADGVAELELVTLDPPEPVPGDRVLLQPLVRRGEIAGREPLGEARERHQRALAELPPHALQLSRGYPAIPTVFEPNGD
jgi:nicotinate phosphoribosyltransferase